MREGSLDELATIHPTVTDTETLFETLDSFRGARWAFRGQRQDWPLTATIERYSCRPGVAEDYVMREFRRRFHRYAQNAPGRDDDLEWLALMQHHGAPTRLLDWTRSAQIAAFFAAQASSTAHPFVNEGVPTAPPFIIWAVDTDSINAHAKAMLRIAEDADLSCGETFRRVFWSQPAEGLYVVVAVEPYRLNERLTVQHGLFLFANHALFPFHNCLARLLLHAKGEGQPSAQWLHKVVVSPGARADVLRALEQVNITATTLFPGLDGFCQSLQVAVQLRDHDGWPGVSLTSDREHWVKGR